MTEEEWLAGEDPEQMLEFLEGRASDRKFRLCAVGCCRRVWSQISYPESRRAVEVAERYADGLADGDEMGHACRVAYDTWAAHAPPGRGLTRALQAAWVATNEAAIGCSRSVLVGCHAATVGETAAPEAWERRAQSELVLDIFGNPFRPPPLDPVWQSDTALSLAKGMYESRDFSAMPILADALQDADCDNADILNHCRGPGPHVRGCWVVDLVLGKG